jgi:hypothetical protein
LLSDRLSAQSTMWRDLRTEVGSGAHAVSVMHLVSTNNDRRFPSIRLPATIEVETPAVFAHHTVSINSLAVRRAIDESAARSGRRGPPLNVTKILAALEDRYGFTDVVYRSRADWP